MSVEAMALALHHSKASGAAKLVLLGIANHDGDGGAWPAVATLAKYAGMTGTPESNARAVRRILGKLAALGEITIERQAGGTKDMPDYERPNLYHVTLTCPPECDGTTKHKMSTVKTPGLHNPPGEGHTTRSPRVTQPAESSTQPPSEPSSGSDDRNAGLPAGSNAPRPTTRKINRKLTQPQIDRMNADFRDLTKLCKEVDQDDPYSVWWTLRLEHKATSPYCFMADLVEKGQWEGFVGRHGITEYERPERSA